MAHGTAFAPGVPRLPPGAFMDTSIQALSVSDGMMGTEAFIQALSVSDGMMGTDTSIQALSVSDGIPCHGANSPPLRIGCHEPCHVRHAVVPRDPEPHALGGLDPVAAGEGPEGGENEH